MASRSEIDRKTASLRKRHDQSQAPVDVESIATAEGLMVVRRPLDANVSGLLLRNKSQAVLGINGANHPRRQRFTIAHELGHWFLHPGRPYTVDSTIKINRRDDVSSLATDREEIEANNFAASLLMPSQLVYTVVERLRLAANQDPRQLTALLAARFDVSEDAMSFRLHNLGITS